MKDIETDPGIAGLGLVDQRHRRFETGAERRRFLKLKRQPHPESRCLFGGFAESGGGAKIILGRCLGHEVRSDQQERNSQLFEEGEAMLEVRPVALSLGPSRTEQAALSGGGNRSYSVGFQNRASLGDRMIA